MRIFARPLATASILLAFLFLAGCAPVPLMPGKKVETPYQCRDQAARGGDCDRR